jgi:hypothetical protein
MVMAFSRCAGEAPSQASYGDHGKRVVKSRSHGEWLSWGKPHKTGFEAASDYASGQHRHIGGGMIGFIPIPAAGGGFAAFSARIRKT